MPDFSQLFMRRRGGPLEYNGRAIVMMDRYPVPATGLLHVSLLSTNSAWKQGVRLDAKGTSTVNGGRYKKGFFLWEDTMPKVVSLVVEATDGELRVWNTWDTGDGVAHSWLNGAAMIVEARADGTRIYHCNDGHPDENFDDIVFSIGPHGIDAA